MNQPFKTVALIGKYKSLEIAEPLPEATLERLLRLPAVLGLRERVHLVEGEMTTETAAGKGFILTIEVPG